MAKPVLYLFVGIPGAGKTTIAKLIQEATGATHLWADQERQAMFDTVCHSQQESQALYEHLNDRTADLLETGNSVIFDTNFNYCKDRDHLRSLAEKHGATTQIIWMTTPVDVARDRALHEHHRDRNGYDSTMTAQDFDRLIDHLEPPTAHENFITIDGTNIDTAAIKRQLGI